MFANLQSILSCETPNAYTRFFLLPNCYLSFRNTPLVSSELMHLVRPMIMAELATQKILAQPLPEGGVIWSSFGNRNMIPLSTSFEKTSETADQQSEPEPKARKGQKNNYSASGTMSTECRTQLKRKGTNRNASLAHERRSISDTSADKNEEEETNLLFSEIRQGTEVEGTEEEEFETNAKSVSAAHSSISYTDADSRQQLQQQLAPVPIWEYRDKYDDFGTFCG